MRRSYCCGHLKLIGDVTAAVSLRKAHPFPIEGKINHVSALNGRLGKALIEVHHIHDFSSGPVVKGAVNHRTSFEIPHTVGALDGSVAVGESE